MRALSILALLLAVLLQLQHLPAAAAAHEVLPVAWRNCNSELQIVNCGEIPLTRGFRAHRAACCKLYRPVPLPSGALSIASVAVVQQSSTVSGVPRNDLNVTGGYLSSPPAYPYSVCGIRSQVASIPVYTMSNGATQYSLASFTVPVLNKTLIQKIKTAAQNLLPLSVRNNITSMRSVDRTSSIIHPGSAVGPAELALLLNRLGNGSAVQLAAKSTLIDGTGVVPKNRPASDGGVWAPPTNCPVTGYQSAGFLAMPNVQIRYGGINADGINCSAAYDPRATTSICGHVSFVEMDAQMVYKMALAWYATNDVRYARQVLSIINSWATINKDWGWHWENGPLEAGWGIAAMARALELVRSQDTTKPTVISNFLSWVNKVPMQDMQYYTVTLTAKNLPNQYGNWHSTLAEAYMALGVLGNNRTMFNSGVSLFTATVADYLKWGRGNYAVQYGNITRLPGESSETMRDHYHTQFGLGGLLQAAEIAWQQDDDLYSASNYALPAAMELHARVTNAFAAGKSTEMLPPTFKYYNTDMPAAPANCSWRFDTGTQLWQAVWTANGTLNYELRDGFKYMLGIGFLPTGWEMGYNHYVGRLGMQLPETAAMLSRSWPEWQEFHWGSGTLTHAETAQPLWRAGVTSVAICNKATPTTARAAVTTAAAPGGSSSITTESAVASPAAVPGPAAVTAVEPAAAVQPATAVQPAAAVQPTAAVQPAAAVQPVTTTVQPAAAVQPVTATVQPAAAVQPATAAVDPAAAAAVQPAAAVEPATAVEPTAAVEPAAAAAGGVPPSSNSTDPAQVAATSAEPSVNNNVDSAGNTSVTTAAVPASGA